MSVTRAFVDGEPASTAALIRFARTGYGHFTTLQVRAGAVRGLGLHLARLDEATRQLFGISLDLTLVRDHLRAALSAAANASVRISVGARNFSVRTMPTPAQIETLVLVDPPAAGHTTPARLATFEHVRHLPWLKHCGNFDLFELRRRALTQGFDDALLLTPKGHIAEGPTFNVGFFQGESIIWPLAPQLEGTTMQLLKQAQESLGGQNVIRPIDLGQIERLHGGFCCHSGAIWPIAAIDQQTLPLNAPGLAKLRRLWAEIPGEPV